MRGNRLKNLAAALALCLMAAAAVLYIIAVNSRPRSAFGPAPALGASPVILDAGHGGRDGGAVSGSGTAEAGINLAITLKTRALMEFFGVKTLLTRADATSLGYDPQASTRKNKNADLNARLALAQANPESAFLSIHLNKFSRAAYAGAQVFYGAGEASAELARALQTGLRAVLDAANTRQARPAPEGVYLMREIAGPAVTIECGFLSNPREEALLQQDGYQSKLALAITAGYLSFISQP